MVHAIAANPDTMSLTHLTDALHKMGVDTSHVLERQELVDMFKTTQVR